MHADCAGVVTFSRQYHLSKLHVVLEVLTTILIVALIFEPLPPLDGPIASKDERLVFLRNRDQCDGKFER